MLDKLTGLEPDLVTAAAKDKKKLAEWWKALGAPAPEARGRAAFLIAQLSAHVAAHVTEPLADAEKKLAAQIKKEKDDGARASEILALGEVARKSGTFEHSDALDLLTGDDSERTPKPPPVIVRLAAILALGVSDPIWLTASQVALLEASTDVRGDAKTFPWNGGDMGGILQLALPSLRKVDVTAALRRLTGLMEKFPPGVRKDGRPSWAGEVLGPWGRLVGRLGAALSGRSTDEPAWSELSPELQQVLRFGVEHRLNMVFSELGLDFQLPRTPSMSGWRRYVKLDPEGPLDREISVTHEGQSRRQPLWKWLRLLHHGKVSAADLSAAISKALSPSEIIDLARDATHLFYAMPNEDGLADSPRSSLLHHLVLGLDASVTAPDLPAVKYSLQALHEGKAREMKKLGWTGGPFSPPESAPAL